MQIACHRFILDFFIYHVILFILYKTLLCFLVLIIQFLCRNDFLVPETLKKFILPRPPPGFPSISNFATSKNLQVNTSCSHCVHVAFFHSLLHRTESSLLLKTDSLSLICLLLSLLSCYIYYTISMRSVFKSSVYLCCLVSFKGGRLRP